MEDKTRKRLKKEAFEVLLKQYSDMAERARIEAAGRQTPVQKACGKVYDSILSDMEKLKNMLDE